MSVPFTSGRRAVGEEVFHQEQADQCQCQPGPDLVAPQAVVGNHVPRPAGPAVGGAGSGSWKPKRSANSFGVHRAVSDSSGSVLTT